MKQFWIIYDNEIGRVDEPLEASNKEQAYEKAIIIIQERTGDAVGFWDNGDVRATNGRGCLIEMSKPLNVTVAPMQNNQQGEQDMKATATTTVKEVNYYTFLNNLEFAQAHCDKVNGSTTPWCNIEDKEGNRYFLGSTDQAYNIMGYMISATGEFTSLFSLIPGQGDLLVQDAIKNGALHADHFDGYLTGFYKKHGFREVRRETNWIPGGPDVIYISL